MFAKFKQNIPAPIKDFLKAQRAAFEIWTRPWVRNYFNTSYKKRVLISYITKPFVAKTDMSHSAYQEAIAIAQVFNECGFIVDIIDFENTRTINYNRYDIIFGFGEPLEKSFYKRTKPLTTIYFGTGASVRFQNNATLERLEAVRQKKNVLLPQSGRLLADAWPLQDTLSDAFIIEGNDFTASTYEHEKISRPVYTVPVSYYEVVKTQDIVTERTRSNAQKNFLWFGSSGLVHKGLDIVLEAFARMPDLTLHVCGPITQEPGFVAAYARELQALPNIQVHGFIDVHGPLFKELLTQCAFTVFPSCCEGGAASVVTVIGNGGLIPIVTRESSVAVENFGFLLPNFESESVVTVAKAAAGLSEAEIAQRGALAAAYAQKHHSLEAFRNNFKNALQQILAHSYE